MMKPSRFTKGAAMLVAMCFEFYSDYRYGRNGVPISGCFEAINGIEYMINGLLPGFRRKGVVLLQIQSAPYPRGKGEVCTAFYVGSNPPGAFIAFSPRSPQKSLRRRERDPFNSRT